MTIITTARRLDWAGWVAGIWKAVIVGGTGAISASFANVYLDPRDNNLAGGLHHLLLEAGLTFCVAAAMHLVTFLNSHPLPDPVTPDK